MMSPRHPALHASLGNGRFRGRHDSALEAVLVIAVKGISGLGHDRTRSRAPRLRKRCRRRAHGLAAGCSGLLPLEAGRCLDFRASTGLQGRQASGAVAHSGLQGEECSDRMNILRSIDLR
jgi:hypothetical protein